MSKKTGLSPKKSTRAFAHNKKRMLLTGGAGFIGHHTVEHFLKNTNWDIVVLDKLSYSGNLNFLSDLDTWDQYKDRVFFVFHDFQAPISETTRELIGKIDYVVHMGAESHVDRSIENPMEFAMSNVVGCVNILDYAKTVGVEKFIYISTDEVYGPSINGHLHKEGEAHHPSNPYSASKSGAEAMCYAYWNTYNMPILITNTMNNFGERQNREKFIPRVLRAAILGEPLYLHCKKDEKGNIVDTSSRCWLHARNHADAVLYLLEHGNPGERYNVAGEWASVKDISDMIEEFSGKKINFVFEDFHSLRPGHDMHYGLDGTKMKEMGWVAPHTLRDSLKHVVEWSLKNPKWL